MNIMTMTDQATVNRTPVTCSNHCITAATKRVVCLISLHFKAINLLENCNELIEIVDQLKLKVSVKDESAYVKIAATHERSPSVASMLIDRILHLHVEFPQDPSDYTNILTIQLVIASKLFPGRFTQLGESTVHLHQIAHETPFSAIATLSNDVSEAIGTVKMDCSLNYGIFGYGQSLQLHNSYKDKEESIKWTTFPRVLSLPEYNMESSGAALSEGWHHESANCTNHCRPKPGTRVHAKMKRLNNWMLQCGAIKDRSKRMQFLQQLVKSDGSVPQSTSFQEPGIITRNEPYLPFIHSP